MSDSYEPNRTLSSQRKCYEYLLCAIVLSNEKWRNTFSLFQWGIRGEFLSPLYLYLPDFFYYLFGKYGSSYWAKEINSVLWTYSSSSQKFVWTHARSGDVCRRNTGALSISGVYDRTTQSEPRSETAYHWSSEFSSYFGEIEGGVGWIRSKYLAGRVIDILTYRIKKTTLWTAPHSVERK